MSKKKLHRWALLDKAGVTRHNIEAPSRPHAIKEACKRLKRGIIHGLPKGWQLKDLGPVDIVPAPTPEPRAFKVGDRVEGLRWSGDEPASGTITGFDSDGDPFIDGPHGVGLLKRHTCRNISPAPQPKAEEGKGAPSCLCHSSASGGWQTPDACPIHGWRKDPTPERVAECIRSRDYNAKATERFLDGLIENPNHPSIVRHGDLHMMLHRLMGQFQEALGMPGASWPQMVARIKVLRQGGQETASLKAEVEVLKQAEELAKLTALTYERRAEAAEAKLDDIKALVRSTEIMLRLDVQDLATNLVYGIQSVLDRDVSAISGAA